jgi:predicted  nucleic acid-binding Zn-ribbon protein
MASTSHSCICRRKDVERNQPPVHAAVPARLRTTLSSLACVAAILAATAAVAQPSPTAADVPAATIRRIIEQEAAFCRQTDTATAAQLTGIEADIQRAMTASQQKVDKLLADSTALAQAVTRARTKFDQLETRVGELQVARSDAAAKLKPLDDKIAAAEGATGSGPSRHEQLMAEEANLRARIQTLQEEVKKANKAMEGMSAIQAATANEGPIADLRKAQQDLDAVMEELRTIRRQTHPIRYSAEYIDLRAKWEKADADAKSAEVDRDNAKKELDAAELEMSKFDAAALELARDENLYAYEHLYRAKMCVEKRRKDLAKPADAPAAPPQAVAAGASGKWGVTCKWNDRTMSDSQDGGTFSLSITPTGVVTGTYVSGNATYPVTGQVAANGSAGGTGSGSGWSVNWSGTIQRTAAGGATGNGGVTVTVSDLGGGTCTGGWSIP